MQIRPPWAFCFPPFDPLSHPLFIHSSLRFSPSNPAGIRTHELPGHTKIPPPTYSLQRRYIVPLSLLFFNLRSGRKHFPSLSLQSMDEYRRKERFQPSRFTCFRYLRRGQWWSSGALILEFLFKFFFLIKKKKEFLTKCFSKTTVGTVISEYGLTVF